MKLRFISLLIRLLDRMDALHRAPCLAFGGYSGIRDQIRLCNKHRWHTDSHAFDWVNLEVLRDWL